jgi:hypothetical protein
MHGYGFCGFVRSVIGCWTARDSLCHSMRRGNTRQVEFWRLVRGDVLECTFHVVAASTRLWPVTCILCYLSMLLVGCVCHRGVFQVER